MQYQYQREGWFLDAASIYCDAVQSLADDSQFCATSVPAPYVLSARSSRPMSRQRSSSSLVADTGARQEALASIRYCTRIRDGRVDVSRYEGQADYSAEVLETFERFKQGAVKDYQINYRRWPGMNHVAAQILQLVARLFPDEFPRSMTYCRQHAEFFDETIRQFERELQLLSCLSRLHRTAQCGRTELQLSGCDGDFESDLRRRHLRPGARQEACRGGQADRAQRFPHGGTRAHFRGVWAEPGRQDDIRPNVRSAPPPGRALAAPFPAVPLVSSSSTGCSSTSRGRRTSRTCAASWRTTW